MFKSNLIIPSFRIEFNHNHYPIILITNRNPKNREAKFEPINPVTPVISIFISRFLSFIYESRVKNNIKKVH